MNRNSRYRNNHSYSIVSSFGWIAIIILVVVTVLSLRISWPESQYRISRPISYSLIFATVVIGAYLLYRSWRRLNQRLNEKDQQLELFRQRMVDVLQMSHRFVRAESEEEVIQAVLEISIKNVGAMGVSFVPLDERGKPLPAVSLGNQPPPILKAWSEHLATPAVRDACIACQSMRSDIDHPCPLLPAPFLEAHGVRCLPVKRGELELGMLNLYFLEDQDIAPETQSFLNSMVNEMALAFEIFRLRQREMFDLQQIRSLRRVDRDQYLETMLANLIQTAQADIAFLKISEGLNGENTYVARGFQNPENQPWLHLDHLVEKNVDPGQPSLLKEFIQVGGLPQRIQTVVVEPLCDQTPQPFGRLVLGYTEGHHAIPDRIPVVRAYADLIAFSAPFITKVSDLEFQAIMAERTRLAREIHDGLAQTLGFLKLTAAQIQNYLEKGELDQLRSTVEQYHSTIAEAYHDAREAIDGLRVSPQDPLVDWIYLAAQDFQEMTGIPVDISGIESHRLLPPEIQAQLIRILQEALTNARKHSNAQQVWITCREWENDLIFEIRDDGRGFDPKELIKLSQHGLRGMKERADLIGADFQITSYLGESTTVRVQIPVKSWEGIR